MKTLEATVYSGLVRISFDDGSEAMREKVKDMVTFWAGGEEMIEKYGLLEAFMKVFTQNILNSKLPPYPTAIINEKIENGRLEGFYPLDGRHGIQLEAVYPIEWTDRDINVSEA